MSWEAGLLTRVTELKVGTNRPGKEVINSGNKYTVLERKGSDKTKN